MLQRYLCLLAILLTPLTALARNVEDVENPREIHAGWVIDEAGILGVAETTIENRIALLHSQLGTEVAWVVLNSIGDSDARTFATALLHRWGVGNRERDDGVLVLHVLDKRHVEVVTGYGVEGTLSDIKCSWLLHEVAIPAFRDGDLVRGHLGLSAGIAAALRSPSISHDELIAAAVAGSHSALASEQSASPRDDRYHRATPSAPGRETLRTLALLLAAFAVIGWVMRIRALGSHMHDVSQQLGLILVGLIILPFGSLIMLAIGLLGGPLWPAVGALAVSSGWNLVFGYRERKARMARTAPRPCEKCSGTMVIADRGTTRGAGVTAASALPATMLRAVRQENRLVAATLAVPAQVSRTDSWA